MRRDLYYTSITPWYFLDFALPYQELQGLFLPCRHRHLELPATGYYQRWFAGVIQEQDQRPQIHLDDNVFIQFLNEPSMTWF